MGHGIPSNTQAGYDKPRHGCDVELALRRGYRVSHLLGYDVTYPTIRSYQDGVKVGCTFITTEAMKKIYEWHQSFLEGKTEKTWQ